MANGVFDAYRNNVIGTDTFANVEVDTDTVRSGFVDAADKTLSLSVDDAMNDVIAAGRVPATWPTNWPALASKTLGTVAVGVVDAADSVFTALTGDPVEQILIAKDTGVEANDILLAMWDTGVTGLPFTPSGGDVTIAWAAGGIWRF